VGRLPVCLFVCLLVGVSVCIAFRFVLLVCLHPLSFRVRLALQMGLFVCFQLAFVLFLMISSMDAFEQWKQVFHVSASPGRPRPRSPQRSSNAHATVLGMQRASLNAAL
jgi:hypothetical protein